MTQLTNNFTLDELLASPTATAKGIAEQFTPAAGIVANLTALAQKVLQPLRDKLGRPITITSGYRCPRLNAAVGGERLSQHLMGEAADILAAGMTVQELYAYIKQSGLAFDQLIIEHDGQGDYWVHISYNPELAEQRGQCMVGTLLSGGGTSCREDGLGSFKQA
jgi:zinc D-Ala-D-Ala carboxypeptidase